MRRPAIIVDLDETLADTRHRMHVVTGRDYNADDYEIYYRNLEKDEVYPHIWRLVLSMAKTHEIIFMTGRPEKYRDQTHKWIWRKTGLIPYDTLFMRPHDTLECDTKIKAMLYEKHVKPKWTVEFVLEDRTKVVKMWRELGLPCLQVQQSDY